MTAAQDAGGNDESQKDVTTYSHSCLEKEGYMAEPVNTPTMLDSHKKDLSNAIALALKQFVQGSCMSDTGVSYAAIEEAVESVLTNFYANGVAHVIISEQYEQQKQAWNVFINALKASK